MPECNICRPGCTCTQSNYEKCDEVCGYYDGCMCCQVFCRECQIPYYIDTLSESYVCEHEKVSMSNE